MNSDYRTPTRLKWVVAAVLTVVSDLAATLAQFMPMKSVFILAADDIPSFFPDFLIEAGPISAALALVVAAGVSATVARWSRLGANSLAQPTTRNPAAASTKRWLFSETFSSSLTTRQLSSLILVAVLSVASILISIAYTVSVALWMAVSMGVLAFLVHRGERKPPYPNGRVQFEQNFRTWMGMSSLWAVVGGAILALLISPPALGLTGILLAAVFLRRLQQVFPDIVPLFLLAPKSGGTTPQGGAASHPLRSPYDFLGTPVGERLLTESLRELGCETFSWQVCGQPDGSQMTILVRDKTSGQTRLVRLFSFQATHLREREFDLRTAYATYLPTAVQSTVKTYVAGLPALDLKFPEGKSPVPGRSPTPRKAQEFKLDWELDCAKSDKLQESLRAFPIPDPEEFLLPMLLGASRIKGSHTADVKELIGLFPALRDRYMGGPRVISTGGPLQPEHLIKREDGFIEITNYSNWTARLLGTEWSLRQPSTVGHPLAAVEEALGGQAAADAQLRHLTSTLLRQLKRKSSAQIGIAARNLVAQIRA